MSHDKDNYARLSRFAVDRGFSLFGVADITEERGDFLLPDISKARYDRAVVMGKRLMDGVMVEIEDQPTSLYFHHYRQINFFLDRRALAVADYIQNSGYLAMPIAASQILDWDKQTSHVSHKKMGWLAGLEESPYLEDPRFAPLERVDGGAYRFVLSASVKTRPQGLS